MNYFETRLVDTVKMMDAPTDWLNTPFGTACWIDGLEALQNLGVQDLASPLELDPKKPASLSSRLLRTQFASLQPGSEVHIISDYIVALGSPFYAFTRDYFISSGMTLKLRSSKDLCAFAPWSKTIELSAPFVTSVAGLDRIQFFTLNHEVCHALYNEFYNRAIDESDEDVIESLLLIEWFCIASDFVLARELADFDPKLLALIDLTSIEKENSAQIDKVLQVASGNEEFAIKASEELKTAFLNANHSPIEQAAYPLVERLLGTSTVNFHVEFSKRELLSHLPISTSLDLKTERAQLVSWLKSSNVFSIAEELRTSIKGLS